MPEVTFSITASGNDGENARAGSYVGWDDGSILTGTATTSVLVRKVRHLTFNFHEIITGHLVFNTSSLPDDAAITSAVLRIKVAGKSTAEARSLDLEWYDHGAAINDADYTATVGTTAGSIASATWQAWANNTVQDITLSSPETVSKTGNTGIRLGISGGQPPAAGDFDTNINFFSFDHASEPEPQLIVNYTVLRQELRPDADLATTGWSTAPLFSKVNETEADGTVITSETV